MLTRWCPSAARYRRRDVVLFVDAGGGLDFGGGRMSAGQFLVELDSQGRLRCFRTLHQGPGLANVSRIATDHGNNIAVVGMLSGTGDFGSGPAAHGFTSGGSDFGTPGLESASVAVTKEGCSAVLGGFTGTRGW